MEREMQPSGPPVGGRKAAVHAAGGASQPAAPERALAEFATGLSWEALPGDVREKARACLLYGLSVGLASLDHPLPVALWPAEGSAGRGGCPPAMGGPPAGMARRMVDGGMSPVGEAAFHNAIVLHARAQEDAHPAGHVGVVVVPAAMAVAEGAGASGKELLTAIVAGYEVALRLARDHVLDSSRHGFRSTSLYGVFGAAAASARLMGADARGVQRALSLASNLAAGLRGFVQAGSDEYVLHAAFAAQQGIAAAALADRPIRVASRFLDTPAGFFRATGFADTCYSGRVARELGEDYEFRRVTYKPYPACQFNRNVIKGMLSLRAQTEAAPLARVEIRMRPFEAEFFGVALRGPFSAYAQTFMSAPFCAATAWLRGGVSHADMQCFDAADVLALARRVNVVSEPGRPAYHPRITVHYEGGGADWRSEDAADDYLLDWSAAVRMAGLLASERPGADEGRAQLVELIGGLEGARSLEGLSAALGRAAGQAWARGRSSS